MSDGKSRNWKVSGRWRIGPIAELPISSEVKFVFPPGATEAQRESVSNMLAQFRSLCYMEFLSRWSRNMPVGCRCSAIMSSPAGGGLRSYFDFRTMPSLCGSASTK